MNESLVNWTAWILIVGGLAVAILICYFSCVRGVRNAKSLERNSAITLLAGGCIGAGLTLLFF